MLPTNLKPRALSALLIASDAAVVAGSSASVRQAFCFGSPPTKPHSHAPGSTPADYYAAGAAAGLDFLGSAEHSDSEDLPVVFSEDCLAVPDIAGWRRERVPTLPPVAHLELAPDWLCEVLSPSTESVDRAKKLKIYAREGVGHVWLLNPLLQTLEVLRLESPRWSLVATHDGAAVVRVEPFDAIELELGALWV